MTAANQSRIGDIGHGICPAHHHPESYLTIFVSGATTVKTNGSTSAVVGTVGVSTCGHTTIALTGSSTVRSEGSEMHRVGDIGMNYGMYTTLTGSSNVLTG